MTSSASMLHLVGEALHRSSDRHPGGIRIWLIEHDRQLRVAVLHLDSADDSLAVRRREPLNRRLVSGDVLRPNELLEWRRLLVGELFGQSGLIRTALPLAHDVADAIHHRLPK